jgi:nucleoside-diphosphate-sugar epimerase
MDPKCGKVRNEIKKVFIAGGTGFLGFHAGQLFLEKGIAVDTIALPDEIIIGDWFPKSIGLRFGNLFQMSGEEIAALLKEKHYDAFVYALGPDDRVIPSAPAAAFFHDKLVVQARKICLAAKNAGIKRCVVLNSYFSYFDRLTGGKLAKKHPYIQARVEQEEELINLGEAGIFEVMILELPYIFGTMPGRKPLWREHFLTHFDGYKSIMYPNQGGTAAIDVSGVAQAIVAASANGEGGMRYPIGQTNLSFEELINRMMEAIDDPRRFRGLPGWICAIWAGNLDRKLKKKGLESGLDHAKLMTQICNRTFYVDPDEFKKRMNYQELGFDGGKDVLESIKLTMRACYPERMSPNLAQKQK